METSIGQGGYNRVDLGVAPGPGGAEYAAIKRALPTSNRGHLLVREAELTRLLAYHPNVVNVLGSGRQPNGKPYVAYELLGKDLDTVLQQGALPPEELLGLVDDVGGALEAGTRLGLVHHDVVKPSNVAQAQEPATGEHRLPWKVFDYENVQRGKDAVHRGPDGSGALIGTKGYMAPEYWDRGTVGTPSDAFAFSATIYEAATEQPAFPGMDGAERERNTRTKQPMRPSEVNPDLPRAFDAVMAVGLAKDPKERLTVPELREEVWKALEGTRSPELKTRAARILDRQAWSTEGELFPDDDFGRAKSLQSVDTADGWWNRR
ncbi:MAG: serine/threonine protein kinase [Myxococcaceae bacterium]